MLNKIKNNKAADITLIGTAWLLVLIVSICSLFDIYMVTQSKESVISYTKSCEIYALAKNFDADKAFENQQFVVTEEVREDIITTFLEQFDKYVVNNKSNAALKVNSLNRSNCEVYSTGTSIILKVKGINFKVKTLLKNPSQIPFFGGEANDFSGGYVNSSVATKIVFFRR